MAKKNFEELTPEEQRVQVAKDVLTQLKSGKIKAAHGVSVATKNGHMIPEEFLDGESEFCDVTKANECQACALGSLFVASVERMGRLKVKDIPTRMSYNQGLGTYEALSFDQKEIFSYLCPLFSKDQLRLIELAFEHGTGWNYANYDNAVEVKAQDFGNKCITPHGLMRKIMKNIIVNNGTFVP